MLRVLLFAFLLVACVSGKTFVNRVRTVRDLSVNGQPCVIGAGMMYIPPGEPHPVPCPDHKSHNGDCVFGDMFIGKFSCIDWISQEDYDKLPFQD